MNHGQVHFLGVGCVWPRTYSRSRGTQKGAHKEFSFHRVFPLNMVVFVGKYSKLIFLSEGPLINAAVPFSPFLGRVQVPYRNRLQAKSIGKYSNLSNLEDRSLASPFGWARHAPRTRSSATGAPHLQRPIGRRPPTTRRHGPSGTGRAVRHAVLGWGDLDVFQVIARINEEMRKAKCSKPPDPKANVGQVGKTRKPVRPSLRESI